MKQIRHLLLSLAICQLSTSFASECHVGFKLGNGVFTQQLQNGTERRLSLKDYAGDQFSLDQLQIKAERKYNKLGYFEKCDLSGVSYGGERFSRFATAAKKGLVGAGLFTAGLATFYLTILAATQPSDSKSVTGDLSADNKSNAINKDLVVITTYDHLDPFYHGPIVHRRYYRTHHVHYHTYYMTAAEYHRMRSIEAGAIIGTLLLIEAFEVPRNMRSTNFHGPAEKSISEADCDTDTIKQKLVFDQYLYCGDFDSDAAQKFARKESVARETAMEFFSAIKRGKFKQARKLMTRELTARSGNDSTLAQMQRDLIGTTPGGINDVKVLDGRSPFEAKQRLSMNVWGQAVELECKQEWSYQKNELYAVGADFIPLNRYKECAVSNLGSSN